MQEANTQNLMNSLKESTELEAVLKENSDQFIAQPLSEALEKLLIKKGMKRAQAIRCSMLNMIYGQQIFSGVRTPSRDKLLAIAFGMKLTFEETDILLKQQGYPCLYPRNERDAVLIYGLLHGVTLMDINALLYENGLQTIL